MPTKLKITTIGNSAGIVLPKDILAHLNVQKGDSLTVTKSRGGIQLVPDEESFSVQLEATRRVMHKYRDVLKKLAE